MIKKISLFILSLFLFSTIFVNAKGVVPGSMEGVNTSSRPDLMRHIFDGMTNTNAQGGITPDYFLVYNRGYMGNLNSDSSFLSLFFDKKGKLYALGRSSGKITAFTKESRNIISSWGFHIQEIKDNNIITFFRGVKEMLALPGKKTLVEMVDNKYYILNHNLNTWDDIINQKQLLIEGENIKIRVNKSGDLCYLKQGVGITCLQFRGIGAYGNDNKMVDFLNGNPNLLNKDYIDFFLGDQFVLFHNTDKTLEVYEIKQTNVNYERYFYSLPFMGNADSNFISNNPYNYIQPKVKLPYQINDFTGIIPDGYKIRKFQSDTIFEKIGLFAPSLEDIQFYTLFEHNGERYFSVSMPYGNREYGNIYIVEIHDDKIFEKLRIKYGYPFFEDENFLFTLSQDIYPSVHSLSYIGYSYVGQPITGIFGTNYPGIGKNIKFSTFINGRTSLGYSLGPSNERAVYVYFYYYGNKDIIEQAVVKGKKKSNEENLGGFVDKFGSYSPYSGVNSYRRERTTGLLYRANGRYTHQTYSSNYDIDFYSIYRNMNGNIKAGDIRDNCDLQGNYGGGCPIQNACKILQDPKSMSENGLITGACPPGKEVLPGEIGFKTSGAGSGLNCVHIVEDDMVKAAKPIIDTSIEGKCSATNCTGIEPWYQADNLNNILIKTTLRPQTLTFTKGLTTPHTYQGELYLDTLSVYVNGVKLANNGLDSQITPLNSGIPLSGHTSQPVPFSIRLNGEGGARGNKGINYINIEICDYVFDDNHKAIPPNRKYLLNCTTESLVVKIDPSQDDEANDGFNLNQKVKNCNDLGYTLTEGSEWMFPVQADGTYIESCNKENTNCVPKAKNVCNFQCAKGYIKDGNKCVLETKQLNCNDKLGALLPNEEWNNPPNVHPIYGTFMAQYKTLYHTYVPTLDYCQKKCKLGYQRDINGGCSELRKERQCGVIDGENDNSRRLGNFERFVNDTTELVDPVTSLPNEGLTKLPFQQFWEDKPDNTGYFDSLLDTNTEYQPPKDTYCAIEQIPGIVPLNGINVCPMGQTGLDYNEDGIIGTCYNNEIKYVDTTTTPEAGKENYTICFYSYNNENEPQQYPYHDFITKNGQIPLVGYTFADPSDISYHDYKYSAGQVPLCINKPQAGLKNSQGRLVPIP